MIERTCHTAAWDPRCDGCNPVRTEHVYPPIPLRGFDWAAVRDNYEPPLTVGHGATEAQAVADLRQQEEDEADD